MFENYLNFSKFTCDIGVSCCKNTKRLIMNNRLKFHTNLAHCFFFFILNSNVFFLNYYLGSVHKKGGTPCTTAAGTFDTLYAIYLMISFVFIK